MSNQFNIDRHFFVCGNCGISNEAPTIDLPIAPDGTQPWPVPDSRADYQIWLERMGMDSVPSAKPQTIEQGA
jgi:hypothetical protein